MRNTDYVIHITTKHGRTWNYLKEDDGWTQTGPTGRLRRLSAVQLLSHLLAPLAADQPGLSVRVERRYDQVKGEVIARTKRPAIVVATRTTKKPAAKTTHPKTVADYLAAAPKDKRAALRKLRKAIKAAAPKATEGISYGIVGFKHNGKPLVYFGYARAHCALYGGFDAHAAELKAYDLSKGTIRFPAEKPLPDRLVTKIVKARIAEIERAG